ncbi:MAG TPA: hypothetical protein VFP32_03605 [Candidatus Saccharimonadales bacterium]|nr:hypothetical protein [Candidatus Saccharimonadales bacterium]
MKRIAMSLATIALVALVATSATRAYFSDNSSSLSGITFSTGNADLQLSQVCQHLWYDNDVSIDTFNNVYAGCQFNLNTGNWYPGQQVHNAMYLGNFSTANIALSPSLQLTHLSGDTGLQNVMQMQIWWYGSATGTGWHNLDYYSDNAVSLPNVPAPSNGHPGTLGLNIETKMSPNADNSYAGKTMSFDFHFNAVQAH